MSVRAEESLFQDRCDGGEALPWNQHTRLRNSLPHELKRKESLPSLNSLSLSVYTCLIYPSGFSQRIFGKIKEILLTIISHEVAGTRDQPGDQ